MFWYFSSHAPLKNTHLQNGLASYVYHNNINLYAWEHFFFFFSEDVKDLQIPFQCDPGTCWWQVSSPGSSLDYTKQLAGPQWHAFNRYHGKSKETVMWTLRSVLVICVSKCEISMSDASNDPEIVATVISERKTWSGSGAEWERGEIALFHSYTVYQTGF